MCLVLAEDWKARTKELKQQDEPITAYKVVRDSLLSIYELYRWHLGLNKSGRWFPWVTPLERCTGMVNSGFHFYTNIQDAASDAYGDKIILKCKLDPKHIVAVGHWGLEPSLVATKATVIETINRHEIGHYRPIEELAKNVRGIRKAY